MGYIRDSRRPANGRMGAPQVTIETITVTRPLKVIAFTCCFITVILMTAATSTADWMIAEGWREGLFMQCISAGAPTPLPFGMEEVVGCGNARSASYVRGAAALVIIGLIFDFFGTFLTGLGLRSTDPNKKYKYYRVAIYALIFALIALLLAAIVYPVQFSKDLANEPGKDGGVVEPQLHRGSLDFDDDDNDGVPDDEDGNPEDFDGDGILNDDDDDDDGDDIPDDEDDDDDNDGFPDSIDDDDDNDGIPDEEDADDDGDGILDAEDDDDDGDGIADDVDDDDDNDGIRDDVDDDNEGGDLDTDGDNIPDSEDADDDGDGTPDAEDDDDDNDGIDDDEEIGGPRTFTFGFGY